MSAIILDCNENIVITISEVLAAPPPPPQSRTAAGAAAAAARHVT